MPYRVRFAGIASLRQKDFRIESGRWRAVPFEMFCGPLQQPHDGPWFRIGRARSAHRQHPLLNIIAVLLGSVPLSFVRFKR